jgi:hypothetical protein
MAVGEALTTVGVDGGAGVGEAVFTSVGVNGRVGVSNAVIISSDLHPLIHKLTIPTKTHAQGNRITSSLLILQKFIETDLRWN